MARKATEDGAHADSARRRARGSSARRSICCSSPASSTVTVNGWSRDHVVVFTDFQCQFCRVMHTPLDTMRQELPYPVRVVYRYFPLRSNPRAFGLSLGAVCAARQGRLLAFADVVFPKQDSLGRYEFGEFARISGIRDTLEFNRCVGSTLPRDRIARDVREAARLRISGTPLALIDGRVFRGAIPLDTLKVVLSVADRPLE
ncbi:MAG: hypothetical protein C0496_14840 [Erythrobacter sp.]|nr:hypothetical protein [Erythrobacter sp.]